MKISDISVELVDVMGTDLSIVDAARVSFAKTSEWEWMCDQNLAVVPANSAHATFKRLSDADTKLIKYLAKNKHFSPFNHTFISIRVKAPIFVARQLVKHEYMPWNEVSRRYVDSEPEFYFPQVWRQKADNVKQGSSDKPADVLIEHGTRGKNGIEDPFYDSVEIALETYNFLKSRNVCPEQARMVLPHNLMTEWIWSGTLKAFAKMLQLGLDPHTQVETREAAIKINGIIQPRFPVSLPALLQADQ